MDYDFYKSLDIYTQEVLELRKLVDFYESEIKKSNAKLLEKEISNKRKLEFICHVSHDFKTPLSIIKGYIGLIQEDDFDLSKLKLYCANILKATEHLYQLLEASLEMARSETNSIELEYRIFDTRDVVAEILSLLKAKLDEKSLALDSDIPSIKICADKRLFKQIIYNLVGNAFKYNRINGHISVSTSLVDNRFYFEINDTGYGIAYEHQPQIFEFFSCFDGSRFNVLESTGIGLSLCRKIIRQHGGEIDFQSVPGKGSKFWFYLPLAPI